MLFFFFKQKTAYEMRISDWSSDVCSSDLVDGFRLEQLLADGRYARVFRAVDSHSGSDVVVKFPKPAVLAEPAMLEAFVREALIGVRVASPFLGQVLARGEERQGRPYTVVPFFFRAAPGGRVSATRCIRIAGGRG